MRSIRISDSVWEAIAKRGKFGETENDVLRRVFDLAPEGATERFTKNGRRGRGNQRYAKKRMSVRTSHGQLVVEFVEDGTTKHWELPDRSDKEAIRHLREVAVAFALQHGATDPGQTNAVRKALTEAGYYVSR